MASLTTVASTFTRRVVAGLAGITIEAAAPVVEVPTIAPQVRKPVPAPTVDLFAGFDQFGANTDEMEARFTEAATGTPTEAPKPSEKVEVAAVGPAKPYSPAEMPSAVVIEAAAVAFDWAADSARKAEQAKRKARKTLDRVPPGRFGRAVISWEKSSRQTPDLERIAALLRTIGVDEIPMRDVAPSLRVEILTA